MHYFVLSSNFPSWTRIRIPFADPDPQPCCYLYKFLRNKANGEYPTLVFCWSQDVHLFNWFFFYSPNRIPSNPSVGSSSRGSACRIPLSSSVERALADRCSPSYHVEILSPGRTTTNRSSVIGELYYLCIQWRSVGADRTPPQKKSCARHWPYPVKMVSLVS